MRRIFRVVLVVLGAAGGPADAADLEGPGHNVRVRGPWLETAREAWRSATERLERPACARVLSDFRDAEGRTLQENLDALGLSAPEYMGRVFFYDGRHRRGCLPSRVMAVTAPGSRVVYLCPQFLARAARERELAEAVLIHEVLHTLGLGEDPPSSQAITARVRERCGDRALVARR